jgi:hypothetical protein
MLDNESLLKKKHPSALNLSGTRANKNSTGISTAADKNNRAQSSPALNGDSRAFSHTVDMAHSKHVIDLSALKESTIHNISERN